MSETKNIFTLNLPGSYFPSEAQARQMMEEFKGLSGGSQLIIPPPGATITPMDAAVTAAQMERLLNLLALTDEERAFVRAALVPEQERDFWKVFADFLEDCDRNDIAQRILERATS